MPSDSVPRPDRLAWLRSQGLGLLCGYGTVLLLGAGSLVMAATRDGASAGIGLDDLTGFFSPPRLAHLWLYLLVPLAGLYALNTLLATWEATVRRWRAGVRAPTRYAATILHVAFLLALLAHAVGGFRSEELGQVAVAGGYTPLPGFGEARLVSLEVDRLPGGMPREARAVVEVRSPGGALRTAEVGWNRPLAEGLGSRLALLADLGRARVARLVSGPDACTAIEGDGCVLAGLPVEVLRAGAPGLLVRAPWADGGADPRWLSPDGELALAGARPLQVAGLGIEEVVVLRARAAPGTPWALLSAVLLAAGTALLWRRLADR